MIYDPPFRAMLSARSPAGHRARLTILIFHRVNSSPDTLSPGDVDVPRFDTIVSWLTRWFSILPLEEAAQRLINGELPARSACITFDDGYADNASNALPILLKHGATATFFIATGYLNGGRMWNDTLIEAVRKTSLPQLDLSQLGASPLPVATIAEKRRAIEMLLELIKYRSHTEREEIAASIAAQSGADLSNSLMMEDSDVRKLHDAGMGIGAHTVDHPILRLCDESEVCDQLSESRDYLEALTDRPVRLFAYPNGKPEIDYTTSQARLVERLGFLAAVSTAPGASGFGDDPFQLRRFTPWDKSRHRFALRLLRNLGK